MAKPIDMNKEFFTLYEVGIALGIAPQQVYAAEKLGGVPVVEKEIKVVKKFVTKATLTELLKRKEEAAR